MSKLALLAVFVVLFASLATMGVVKGHHLGDYLPEDSGYAVPGESGTENYANFYWALSTTDVKWDADGDIYSDASSAIANWAGEITQLDWDPDDQNPEVTFVSESCGSQPAAFDIIDWYPDATRNANYWILAEICIDTSENWGSGEEVAALAHEIGHLYALHEQYTGHLPAGCNGSQTSIMDTYQEVGGELVHCDGIDGPQTADENRVNDFYGGGSLLNIEGSGSGTVATYEWEDGAWGEYRQDLVFYYWSGSDWVEYFSGPLTLGVGEHIDIPGAYAELEVEINRTTYSAPSGMHLMCGWPYYWQSDSHGDWDCSDSVWLD